MSPILVEGVSCHACPWEHTGTDASDHGAKHEREAGHTTYPTATRIVGHITEASCVSAGWRYGDHKAAYVEHPWDAVRDDHATQCGCSGPLILTLQDGPDDEPFTVQRHVGWMP